MSYFRTSREYSRIVEEVILTERGLYQKDDAPDDVEVKVNIDAVHSVTFVEEGGVMDTKWLDIPETQNKDDEKGGGYILDGVNVIGHDYLPDQAGPNSTRSILTTIMSTRLSAETKAAADKMKEIKDAS